MVSKNDLGVGILVLIAGIIIYLFSPAGPLYVNVDPNNLAATIAAHDNSHFIGGGLAIIFGIIGVAMYKKVSKITIGVSVLSIILGIFFVSFSAIGPLFPYVQPHGAGMEATGAITAIVGIVGIIGSAVNKTSTASTTAKTEAATVKH